MSRKDKDWQAYERAIARYYESHPNCEVILDAKVAADSGRKRQVDILVRVTAPPDFKITVGVEAKLYSKRIDSDTYDAIRAKFVSIGVDRGVIFCPNGLESGPLKDLQASRNPQIELKQMTLQEVLETAWGDDFLVAIEKLAAAKSAENPDGPLQDHVVDSIERLPLHARYFFYQLTNPAWLPILTERGVLRRAVIRENAIPPLVASEYVCKFSHSHAKEFLAFCTDVHDSFHWLETDLVKSALGLPPDLKSEFLKVAVTWAFDNIIETEGIAQLVTDQVSAGNAGLALQLLARVTRIWSKSSEVGEFGQMIRLESAVKDYWFTELTRKLLPQLVPLDPRPVVDYTRQRLTHALELERPYEPLVLPTFGGVANVAKEGPFGPLDILDILVYTYKDVLLALCETDAAVLSSIVAADIEQRANGALLRVGLCAAGDCPTVRVEIVEIALGHDYLWHDYNIIPELEHLVRNGWGDMSDALRELVVDKVFGLQPFTYRSDNISEADAETYRKNHVIDWLLLLSELGIPDSRFDSASRMLREYSEITNKTKRFEHEGMQVVGIDPTPDETKNFGQMSPAEIIGFCTKFEPRYGFLEEKTPHGVATVLQAEVARRPKEFFSVGEEILSLPYPAYHSAVADGLTDALRTGVAVDRVAASDLLSDIIARAKYTEKNGGRRDSLDNGDPKWVRSAIARFIEQAAQGDSAPLESQSALVSLWDRTWPEADRSTTISGDIDWFTEVINSEAGHLSMALCRLTLRMKSRTRESDVSPSEVAACDNWATALLEKVDKQLLEAQETVVRAPLGFFYSWFFLVFNEWATARRDRIFDRSNPLLWEAAWSCHFWMTQRYVQVFAHLRPHYEHALVRMTNEDTRRREWMERMGEDFAIFWMAGVLTRDDPLLTAFWQKAPARVKSSGTLWINSILKKENWSETWPLARQWWELAFAYRGESDPEEILATFLYWLDSAPSDLKLVEIETLLTAAVESEKHFLGDRFFDFLQARVEEEPVPCARVIEAVARNHGLHTGVSHDQRMKDLMERCFRTNDSEAQQILINAKRLLLSAGLFSYEGVFADEFPAVKDDGDEHGLTQ